MPIDSVLHTNRHSIDRVLNAGLPLLLVFWENHRSPLQATDDELNRIATKYAGRALVAKVDARDESELLGRFEINGIPSFVFVTNGQVVERTPVDNPGYIEAWLNHLTGGGPRPAPPASQDDRTQQRTAGGSPLVLTDANFASVTSGDQPVLVDFWAEWCGPCRMIAPSVEQLAREFDGRAVVGKLNVDENPAVSRQYGIMSIPTLLILKKGKVIDQIVGAQPLPALRQRLAAHAK
jgi:thioredoxin 1